MAALGRPLEEHVAPRQRRRASVVDGPALFAGVFLGVLGGLLIGNEVAGLGYGALVAPGLLTAALSLLCARPLAGSLLAALASSALAALIGVPLLVLRIIGGFW